jgi:hypothetical protein
LIRATKKIQGKIISSINGFGKTGYPHAKEENRALYYIQKSTQND